MTHQMSEALELSVDGLPLSQQTFHPLADMLEKLSIIEDLDEYIVNNSNAKTGSKILCHAFSVKAKMWIETCEDIDKSLHLLIIEKRLLNHNCRNRALTRTFVEDMLAMDLFVARLLDYFKSRTDTVFEHPTLNFNWYNILTLNGVRVGHLSGSLMAKESVYSHQYGVRELLFCATATRPT